eukprot:1149367-Rhodomonas_salina.1
MRAPQSLPACGRRAVALYTVSALRRFWYRLCAFFPSSPCTHHRGSAPSNPNTLSVSQLSEHNTKRMKQLRRDGNPPGSARGSREERAGAPPRVDPTPTRASPPSETLQGL